MRLIIQDGVTEGKVRRRRRRKLNEILVPPKKKETRQKSAIGDRIGKLVLHFHGTKWAQSVAQSTAKVEILTYAAAYTVALSASSFAFLQ